MHVRKIAIALVLVAGCHSNTPDPGPDPDRESGPDKERTAPRPIQLGALVTDEVDFDKGDMTDWKSLRLDKKGTLRVKLHWDNNQMDLNVDVFDRAGEPIASSPGLLPGSAEKSVPVEIDAPGTYFIRVTAPRAHQASVYTLQAKWETTK